MSRRPIAALGIAIAITSSAALAEEPDFSPMKPKNWDSIQATIESQRREEQAQLLRREPAQPAPEVSTYAAPPETTVYTAPAEPYVLEERPRVRTAPPAPTTREATIEHGLFNRAGPNDFGA